MPDVIQRPAARRRSVSPSSWLLRSNFSRAVCHRPESCTTVSCWPPLPSISVTRSSKSDPALSPAAAAVSAPPPSPQPQSEDATDFSFTFPCSDSNGDNSTDGRDRSVECEASVSASSCTFFQSVFNSLSGTTTSSSSRWSFSSDSLGGGSRAANRHRGRSGRSHDSSSCTDRSRSPSPSPSPPTSPRIGRSWFSRVSPIASAKASPESSPLASPRASTASPSASPPSSFRKSLDKSDIKRVLSWSHLLSGPRGGGERAVLSEEEWMVDLSQLLLGERFACGTHSRIYKGMYKDNSVAVKVIRLPDEEDSLIRNRLKMNFTKEVTMLSSLQHRHVIKFVAACKKPPVLCVITEYLPGGSLRSFLHNREGQLLPMSQVVRMALNIASGMEYLHMKGIMHRDLKSENLVLAEDGSLKIVDFGVSCLESECNARTDDPGTYRWMAPEMIKRNHYTGKVDVYSFGIVLWELLTTRLPYEEKTAVQAAFCVLNQNLRPPIPSDCPWELRDLMERCWAVDPDERPEFWEIMRLLGLYEQSLDMGFPTNESPQDERSLPSWLQHE